MMPPLKLVEENAEYLDEQMRILNAEDRNDFF